MAVSATAAGFAERLLVWFEAHGRHDLPWQSPRTPYRVWLSEVMLQQTQVATVIPYFQRFVARFPDVATLASAPADEVLALWAGLGYYARARNLQRAAQQIVREHGGEFPQDMAAVAALPGVGRSTAGAILAQACGQRQAILDGNVRRVLARHAAVPGWPGAPAVQKILWVQAEARLPQTRLADYTQAIMDLGATLCTARAPACARCPVRDDCAAFAQDRVAELPGPKPQRARPQRRAHLLLIENAEGALLLERRPPSGIWGGLWSPPVMDVAEDWRAYCRERLQVVTEAPQTLDAVHHGFTHFDLELLPLRLRASPASAALAEPGAYAWTTLAALSSRGLPAPVKKLLQSYAAVRQSPCPEPSIASSSASTPRVSTGRRTRGRSASASSTTSRSKPGSNGSRTRRA